MRIGKERVILIRSAILVGLALLGSGCARSTKFDPAKVSAATVTDVLGKPAPSDIVAGRREYLIGPYDKLGVQVFGVDELNREAQVDARRADKRQPGEPWVVRESARNVFVRRESAREERCDYRRYDRLALSKRLARRRPIHHSPDDRTLVQSLHIERDVYCG